MAEELQSISVTSIWLLPLAMPALPARKAGMQQGHIHPLEPRLTAEF